MFQTTNQMNFSLKKKVILPLSVDLSAKKGCLTMTHIWKHGVVRMRQKTNGAMNIYSNSHAGWAGIGPTGIAVGFTLSSP